MSNATQSEGDDAVGATDGRGPTAHIERTDVGVSITLTLKRGSGTRDADKIKAEVNAATLEEARSDMEELRAYVDELADASRQIQPLAVED